MLNLPRIIILHCACHYSKQWAMQTSFCTMNCTNHHSKASTVTFIVSLKIPSTEGACMVLVTSYLHFSTCQHGISWMFAKFSAEHPTCSADYGIQLSRVGGETVPPSWWKWPSYARLGRHRVVWTRGTRYAIYVSSDLRMQNIPRRYAGVTCQNRKWLNMSRPVLHVCLPVFTAAGTRRG